MGRIIRLFVSSTFRDFCDERDALARQVFSKMEEKCRREGFSFQVLDLRWGIPEQAALNNETLQICLEEIEHCQRLSPNVNFLLMVGERSGWHPLPPAIPEGEWRQLMAALEDPSCIPQDADGAGRNRLAGLLKAWYVKDENDLRGDYHLRGREGIYAAEPAAFAEVERELREGLRMLASHAGIPPAELEKYQDSATTQEIVQGLLRNPDLLSGKTFAMFQRDPLTEEGEDSRRECAELRAKVRRCLPADQIHTYEAGDDGYLRAVERFLEEKIEEEIRESRSLSAFEEAEENEHSEMALLSRGYCRRPELEQRFAAFLREHTGEVVLLTGPSGSGKSWLIRHALMKLREEGPEEAGFAAVFTDIQPSCRQMRRIYSYLLNQLGLPSGGTPAGNGRLLEWFETAITPLEERRGHVLIFVDCVEGIEDWKEQADSLLQANLPANVTVVVSAIDENSLRRKERTRKTAVFCVNALERRDAAAQILETLRRYGRTLTSGQAERLVSALAEKPLPLHAALLSARLMHQTSFSALPESDAFASLSGAVRAFYFRERERDYLVMRRHILGYFALVQVGLEETELLRILAEDEEVLREVRHYHSGWNESLEASLEYTFPSALWARIYYEILPVLTEIHQDGGVILSLKHNRLRETILQILGKGEIRTLRENLSRYFANEERNPWFWRSEEGQNIPNRRKYEELGPVLRAMGDREGCGKLLSDPLYAGCGISLGHIFSLIREYRERIRGARNTGENPRAFHLQMLRLLQEKQELLRIFPDQFFPAAAAAGLLDPKFLPKYGTQGWLAGGNHRAVPGQYHFHTMEQGRMALREDGILAVLDHGIVQIADLRDGMALDVFCRVPIDDGWIYWLDDDLVIRDESRRAILRCLEDELFLEEVTPAVPYEKVKAPGSLQGQDRYSWPDYETMLSFYYRSFSFRSGRRGIREASLHYPAEDTLKVRFRHHIACVEIRGKELEIIDLERGCLLGKRRKYFAIDEFTISENGALILIRLLDGSMRLVDTTILPAGDPVNLRRDAADSSPRGFLRLMGETGKMLASGARSMLNTDVTVRGGYTALHRGDADKGTDLLPQRMVFSLRRNYAACYYRRGSSSMLYAYSLDTRALLWKQEDIPEMFEDDRTRLPMYTADGGRLLVVLLGGTWHIYNMEDGSHRTSEQRPPAEADRYEAVHRLRREYAARMLEFRVKAEERSGSRTEDVSGIDGRGLLGRISDQAVESLIGSLRWALFRGERKMWNLEMLVRELENLQVVCDETRGRFWLIDPIHDMVHLYDRSGKCLCRDQLDMEATWADLDSGGRLVVMSGDSGRKIVMEYEEEAVQHV